jgi:hypothetical protein
VIATHNPGVLPHLSGLRPHFIVTARKIIYLGSLNSFMEITTSCPTSPRRGILGLTRAMLRGMRRIRHPRERLGSRLRRNELTRKLFENPAKREGSRPHPARRSPFGKGLRLPRVLLAARPGRLDQRPDRLLGRRLGRCLTEGACKRRTGAKDVPSAGFFIRPGA